MPSTLVSELKNTYCIKGFFIVRQKRIPTILAQGFTLPWDKESKVPVIEYWGHGYVYYSAKHNYEPGAFDRAKFRDY